MRPPLCLPHCLHLIRLLACLLWLVWAGGWGTAAQAQSVVLGSAFAAEAAGTRFPLQAVAQEQSLPDDWARSRPASAGPVWYRVSFKTLLAADVPLALYVERACGALTVLLNEQRVHVGPGTDCAQPLLVQLPAALLAPDVNVLDLQLAGRPLQVVATRQRAGSLSVLQIGPAATLAATHASATRSAVTVPQMLRCALLVVGAFVFVVGFIDRREAALTYFGALAVAWALMDHRLWWPVVPLPVHSLELVLATLAAVATLAGAQFLLRSVRLRQPWAEHLLPAQCAAVPISLLLAGSPHVHTVCMVWGLLFMAELAWAAVLCLRHLKQPLQRAHIPLWLAVAAAALTALANVGAEVFAGPAWPARVLAQALTATLALLGMALLWQHQRSAHEAELSKVHLENRIRDATAEIERNFRQLSELRVEQVTERERKRIAADLHDDLGAKLLTIVHTSDSERISTLAREALEEMRLSVRGLTGKPVRLADALGDWRAEVISRLAQAGIEGDWSAADDFPQTLSARAYVQTTRILREATSNIIKHSGASQCVISCRVAEGDFQLVVQDNGDGIPMELDGRLDRGHGMASMKHRAKQLQGQCLVESGPGYGTVIRLTVPLDRAMEATPLA